VYVGMSQYSRRSATRCHRSGYRPRVEPRVELLQPRLPPGNVLGFWLTAPDLERATLPDVPTGLGPTYLGIEGSGAGSTLAYGTFLGGTTYDEAWAIGLDAAANAYVTGYTDSVDFPTTPDAFDTTKNGNPGGFDAFVAKLSASGSTLAYGTYLGGSNTDVGTGIAVDSAGNAYVTGQTYSTNFPTTPGAFDTTHNGASDAFVSKFSGLAALPLTARGDV
jgi:beta-propeller repeat-containing protein